jgi:hypothetical protein
MFGMSPKADMPSLSPPALSERRHRGLDVAA